jgi:hypothetical protein
MNLNLFSKTLMIQLCCREHKSSLVFVHSSSVCSDLFGRYVLEQCSAAYVVQLVARNKLNCPMEDIMWNKPREPFLRDHGENF